MNQKVIRAGIIAVVLGIAAYWYWSPVLAIRGMKTAAVEADAETFNQYVDYPRLRQSIKTQITAMATKEVANDNSPGAAMGTMLGLALMDPIIDAMVRPEMVMRAMQRSKLSMNERESAEETEPESDVQWTTERSGLNTYIVHGSKAATPDKHELSLVLERSGFATWTLTEMRMPELSES